MRILPAALAISAAVHGGAVAYVQTRPPRPEPTRVVTLAPVEIIPAPLPEPSPEAAPTEVMLLDDDTVAELARVASSKGHTKKRGKATASEISTGTATIENPRVETPTKRNTLMTMRHPKIEHGPSAEFWARFAANTKPLQPKEIAGEQLSSEIATAEGNLKNPKWIANATPEQVAGERAALAVKRYEKSNAELRPNGEGTKAEHKTFNIKFNGDGTVAKLSDKANLQRKGLLGGTFDVTDGAMRAAGIDPYASYKLKVLDETRDERAAMGKRYRTQQLAQSRQHVQKHLDRLWAITDNAAQRKQGLFELWDDCAERGSEELIAGGRAAREQVIGFMRSKFPKGSADEFTVAELAHFNKQRKSTATFAPYD